MRENRPFASPGERGTTSVSGILERYVTQTGQICPTIRFSLRYRCQNALIQPHPRIWHGKSRDLGFLGSVERNGTRREFGDVRMNNHQFDKLLLEISTDEEYLRQAEIRLRGVAGILREERDGWQPDPLPEARLRCREAEKEIRRRSLQMMERIDAASSTLTDAQLSGVGTRAQVFLKRVAENMPFSSTTRQKAKKVQARAVWS
jgi:hypothetical protein